MTDNTVDFRAITGGKDDRPRPSNFTIYHAIGDDASLMVTQCAGYSMSTDTMFMIMNEELYVTFIVPVTKLSYVLAETIAAAPKASEIN